MHNSDSAGQLERVGRLVDVFGHLQRRRAVPLPAVRELVARALVPRRGLLGVAGVQHELN